jgi:hypothetical protein
LAIAKAKRAPKRLTSDQQQSLQGIGGIPSIITRGQGYDPAKQG